MKSEKKLIIFDLDKTLTASKSPLDSEMADLIIKLLNDKKVAVISGGKFSQFEKQFLSNLPASHDNFKNLFLLPTSGTRLYVWEDSWVVKYKVDIPEEDRKYIIQKLNEAIKLSGIPLPEKTYGETIEDRESQITYSALGQEAPIAVKEAWDPKKEKRQCIESILKDMIPDFSVSFGGSTSIDITMKGVNKAYGIRKMEEYLNMPVSDMIFIGDQIIEGGNDYSAKETGIDCVQVSGPEETKEVIKGLM